VHNGAGEYLSVVCVGARQRHQHFHRRGRVKPTVDDQTLHRFRQDLDQIQAS
jgi:hypothetical protein